jgi:hypothetical protein
MAIVIDVEVDCVVEDTWLALTCINVPNTDPSKHLDAGIKPPV